MTKKDVSVEAAELLVEYRKVCESKKLEYRALANAEAAKVRMIDKLLTAEKLQEVEDKKAMDAAWSFKQPVNATIIKAGDILMKVIEDVEGH